MSNARSNALPNQLPIISKRPSARLRRRGTVLIYVCAGMVAVCGFVSLAVDYGRVQVAKTELQSAADLAARYAVSGVQHEINGVNAATAMAKVALSENKVDAKWIVNSQVNVEVGKWNPSSKKFATSNDATKSNAVRVTVRCAASDRSAVPLPFASILGFSQKELVATSIALYDVDNHFGAPSGDGNGGKTGQDSYEQKYVPATSNIWLAGSPEGATASNNNPHKKHDKARTATDPGQSPIGMANLRVTPGTTLTFDGVNGGATNDFNDANRYGGDGNAAQIVENYTGAELGKSNLTAPINCVVAVFLTDEVPGSTPPANLDFSTKANRDFHTLRPLVRQVFFIGDGRRDNGDMQQFVVPAGATRLFIGTMDSYEWNNNVGGFTVTSTTSAKIVTVK